MQDAMNKYAGTAEKRILCYGDSNTWGYVPLSGARFSRTERWTGLLAQDLGSGFHVIEEGLNGRTTAWSEPYRRGRNGLKMLLPILESHMPLDLVILMLGTNDMKHHYNCSAYESARGILSLIQLIQNSAIGPQGGIPEILVVVPPKMGTLSEKMDSHFEGGVDKSASLPQAYAQVCSEAGCHIFDSNKVVTVGADGVHLDSKGHEILARELLTVISHALVRK
jgi:lysophospholipase L1-like esterase